ncbi:MAG: type IV secretion system protein [Patescibacteria group bacterium]|nr:type IV secretion system protein [Patescibacteria group bacterium]
MKRISYFLSIFICSLILVGGFFSLSTKAQEGFSLDDPVDTSATDSILNIPSGDSDLGLPGVDELFNSDGDNATNSIIYLSDTPTPTTSVAQPTIELSPTFLPNKIFTRFYLTNYYSTYPNVKYEVEFDNAVLPDCIRESWQLISDNPQEASCEIDISGYSPGNHTIAVNVSPSDGFDYQQTSANVALTKTGDVMNASLASITPTNPSTSVTPGTNQTATTPGSSGSSANINDIFLGSLSTSKINNALTGGKTLVQTLNPATNTSGEKFWVFVVWRFCMSLINAVMVAFLIFLAFVNILRIQMDTYAIKKILPTLVLAVILANFSLLICRAVVDFSDVLVRTFAENKAQLASDLVSSLGLTKSVKPVAAVGLGTLTVVGLFFAAGGAASLLLILVGIIFAFLPGIAILVLAFLLWIRVIVVQVLVAFSPLAFIAMALPMTKSWFAKWWSEFARWVFMAVIIFFLLKIISLMKPATPGTLEIWTLVAAWVILYLTIQVPFKMGGAIMAAWGGIGKAISGIGKGGWLSSGVTMFGQRVGANFLRNKPLGKMISAAIVNKQLYEKTTARTYEKAVEDVWEKKYGKVREKKARGEKLTEEDIRVLSMHSKIAMQEAEKTKEVSPEGIRRELENALGDTPEKRDATLRDWYSGKLFRTDTNKAKEISGLLESLQEKRNSYREGDQAQYELNQLSDIMNRVIAPAGGLIDLNSTSHVVPVESRPSKVDVNTATAQLEGLNQQLTNKSLTQIEGNSDLKAEIARTLSLKTIEKLGKISPEYWTEEDHKLIGELTKLYEQHGDVKTIKTQLSPILSAIVSNPHYLIDKKELFTSAPEGLKKELGVLAEGGFDKTKLRTNIPDLDIMMENSSDLEQSIAREKEMIKNKMVQTHYKLINLGIPPEKIKIPITSQITAKEKLKFNQEVETYIAANPNQDHAELKNVQKEFNQNYLHTNYANKAEKTLSDLISEHKPAQQAIKKGLITRKPI